VRNPAVIVVGDVVRLSPFAPNVLHEVPKEYIYD
jgi:hypothetical protein